MAETNAQRTGGDSRLRVATGRVVAYWQLGCVLCLAAFLRLWGIDARPIWYDEGYSVMLAGHSPAQIWYLTGLDVHPPLYYVLLHYWMASVGVTEQGVRGLSVVCGVVTVLLGYWLARLLSTQRGAVLAALLLTCLPIAVRYSQEARMYALLMVWSLAASIALVYWLRPRPRQGR